MATMKKAQKGGNLGMKSVKAGFDKNPGVTRADIIVAAKGQAKKGIKVKKAQTGDSTSIYKSRAEKAQKNLMTGSLGDLPSNVKGFMKAQKDYKRYTKRGKPGYDESGKSNFQKMIGLKKGGKMTKKCRYGCK